MLLRCRYAFSKLVKLTQYEGKYASIAKLELDHPQKKNAMSIALLNDLDDAIKAINSNTSLRAVIVKSSQEGSFCAGADLKERLDKTPDEMDLIVANLRRILNDIRHIFCPVFSLIDGPALGGGLELALNTDIRISTEKALIGLPETHWGLLPGGGGTQTLSRTIGMAKAKELIFTSRKINGAKALELGIVSYHVQNLAQAEAKAFEIIDQMSHNAPIAIEHAKKAINWGYETDLRTGLQIERFNYERILRTEDRAEGFKAFAQKREPAFKGK